MLSIKCSRAFLGKLMQGQHSQVTLADRLEQAVFHNIEPLQASLVLLYESRNDTQHH